MSITNEIKESIYLQYANDFLTIHRMAEYYQDNAYFGLDELTHNEAYEKLEKLISEGREINHNK